MSDQTAPLTPTRLAQIGGVSVPYAWQVLNGDKRWTKRLAIKVFRETGQKLGPIAGATRDEIDTLERFEGAA